jgi:hypothetical protein
MNVLTIFNLTTNKQVISFQEKVDKINVEVSSICFKEGTKILCKTDFGDKYIPIEQLDDNVYVKAYKNGYKKIKYLIKTNLINTDKRTINKLFVMKKSPHNKLIEDLYVTGSHALLVDNMDEKTSLKMDNLFKTLNVKCNKKIEDKKKVIACFDKRFQEHNEIGLFNIYHLVLENNNNEYKNYGIYANGILAESTDEITLTRTENYSLINLEYKSEIITNNN